MRKDILGVASKELRVVHREMCHEIQDCKNDPIIYGIEKMKQGFVSGFNESLSQFLSHVHFHSIN